MTAGDIHVVPVDDLIEHLDNDCPCGATTEPVPRDDGTIGWLITHHSLDGREHTEQHPQGGHPQRHPQPLLSAHASVCVCGG